ncbi:MAG: hypothetical protein RLZZ304_527 [Actinomycetota bacterium]|jgi:uncharacterized protein (DUF2236 family)
MSKNNRAQEFLSVKFRRLLSGAPDGIPPWLDVVAAGDDFGHFSPHDEPWIVHGDFSTLVGGIRALILQALHPATLAGVAQHSRYEQDPLGRLSGTIRWLTVTTFGSKAAVASEAGRVNRLHERVSGQVESPDGVARAYRAQDEDLLTWVHLAFSEAFLSAHLDVSSTPLPGGADAYVDKWRVSAAPLGLKVDDLPRTRAGLSEALAAYASERQLRCDDHTRQVLHFIEHPPLPAAAGPIYRLLFLAAVANLPSWATELTGYRIRNRRVVMALTAWMLRAMRAAIGPESPIEDAAKARLMRAQRAAANR